MDVQHSQIQKNIDNEWVIDGNKHVTATEFYAYRMHTRDDPQILRINEDAVTYGGMLKQQYDCDNWIKIEQQCFQWQRHNQKN